MSVQPATGGEPGNRTPDIDPAWYANNSLVGGRLAWSPAVP
jgi:hypothetical protein